MRIITEGESWLWWNWGQYGPPSFISLPFIKEMEQHARHRDTKKEDREHILHEFIPWARWYRWYLEDWEAWELDAKVELARGSRLTEAGPTRTLGKGKGEEPLKKIRRRREECKKYWDRTRSRRSSTGLRWVPKTPKIDEEGTSVPSALEVSSDQATAWDLPSVELSTERLERAAANEEQ